LQTYTPHNIATHFPGRIGTGDAQFWGWYPYLKPIATNNFFKQIEKEKKQNKKKHEN